LSQAILKDANISGANFTKANLMWANMSWVKRIDAIFNWTNLANANMSYSIFDGSDFTKANLVWAYIVSVYMIGANLKEAIVNKDSLWYIFTS
jgi:uncharacterized protein YjbI with pentapeptide repeats